MWYSVGNNVAVNSYPTNYFGHKIPRYLDEKYGIRFYCLWRNKHVVFPHRIMAKEFVLEIFSIIRKGNQKEQGKMECLDVHLLCRPVCASVSIICVGRKKYWHVQVVK